MRTHRLALFVVTAIIGVNSPAGGQDKSWVGESVLPTKPVKDISLVVRADGKVVAFPYSGRWPAAVRDDGEGLLRIHDGARDGWVNKADFVRAGDAQAHFDRRLQADPKDTWALLMRGAGRADGGEPDKAVRDFTEAVRLDPAFALAYATRGYVWLNQKNYDKAILDLDEAVRLDPTLARAFNYRGTVWSHRTEYGKAIRDYTEAIRLDPMTASAFSNRANVWSARREFDKAIQDYDEAARLDPTSAVIFYNRGETRHQKGEYDTAIRDFDEAIRLNPKLALAFNDRGLARHAKQEFDKAVADYDAAIRLDPKLAVAYANRGAAWRRKKEYGKAVADYDAAIRLDPQAARSYMSRGNARRDMREYDAAVKDYDEALRRGPKDASAHFNRAVALLMGRRPGAAKGFQDVIDLVGWKGGLAPNAVVLGHLAAGLAGDDAAAKKFLTASAGKLPAAWPAHVAQFMRGEFDEPALLKLADDDGLRTEAHCFLGLHHVIQGHPDAALAHFRWVKAHGDPSYFEHTVALAELDRLEPPAKSPKP